MIIDLLSGLSSQSWLAASSSGEGAMGHCCGSTIRWQHQDASPSNITGDSVPAKASISSDHCIRCGARSLVPVRSWSVVQPYHPQSGSTSPLQTPGSRSQSTDHLDLESTTFRAKQYLENCRFLYVESAFDKAPLLATDHCSRMQLVSPVRNCDKRVQAARD